jgi:hypothetical protein
VRARRGAACLHTRREMAWVRRGGWSAACRCTHARTHPVEVQPVSASVSADDRGEPAVECADATCVVDVQRDEARGHGRCASRFVSGEVLLLLLLLDLDVFDRRRL